MIQRKQTLFLLVAAMVLAVAAIFNTGSIAMLVVLIVAAVVAVADIFLYVNRRLQAKIVVADIFLLIAWYILFAIIKGEPYYADADAVTMEPGSQTVFSWTDALPLVALFLLFMARKGIMSDEKLVRSLDRIR